MARIRSLIWYIFPSFLAVTGLAVFLLMILSAIAIRSIQADNLSRQLLHQAEMFKYMAIQAHMDPDLINKLCKDLGRATQGHFTVIAPDGLVLGDSQNSVKPTRNFVNLPEFRMAAAGDIGITRRTDPETGYRVNYRAVPLRQNGRLTAVILVGIPVTTTVHLLQRNYLRILGAVFAVILLAAAVSYLLARRVDRPIDDIIQGATRFAQGELSYRMGPPVIREMAALSDTMNQMASDLDYRLKTVIRQRNELKAMLSSMVEGVMFVDTDEKLLRYNAAARELLGLQGRNATGRTIQEVVRNSELHRLIRLTLASDGPQEGEIVFRNHESTHALVRGINVRDENGKVSGALIVLNDVTRLNRLERVRRDFVANVSHELKTPITNIKGFIETLRDGAIDDSKNARRFLDIILKHTDHLIAIIEDLLNLSRLEQMSTDQTVLREPVKINDLIQAAVAECEMRAAGKEIRIIQEAPEVLGLNLNAPLMEQALVNLLDNAVKYSSRETEIRIGLSRDETSTYITVVDQGCGIPADALQRIFERFYRVDEGRSSSEGGTGLGLAIVKHIVQVHDGRINVQSAVGEGTTFTIVLPVQPNTPPG